jgi:hypothetical protein
MKIGSSESHYTSRTAAQSPILELIWCKRLGFTKKPIQKFLISRRWYSQDVQMLWFWRRQLVYTLLQETCQIPYPV